MDGAASGWLRDPAIRTDASSHADKANMTHSDMVPFEELSADVQDKDKIMIAAMVANGFIP